jgi:uroporphyrinogen-III synthase
MGAAVILLPAIEIVPPADPEALRQSARAEYDWIVFTSANAVKAFCEVAGDVRAGIACVGTATAEAAAVNGLRMTLMPERYTAESLLPFFPADMRGQRVLIPRSALARDVIPDALRKRGAEVTVVEAYRNVIPAETVEKSAAVFGSRPDWVLFASSSAVDNLCAIAGAETLSECRLGSIGPVTSATIRKHGLEVTVEAEPHTAAGLVEGIRRFYAIMQER